MNVLRKVHQVALLTLRNCMHTVYEDGLRRDMRLWYVDTVQISVKRLLTLSPSHRIGDLRLQTLANYATFRDTTLAKRCLYLFAATLLRDNGFLSVPCCESPYTRVASQSLISPRYMLLRYLIMCNSSEIMSLKKNCFR